MRSAISHDVVVVIAVVFS